MIFFRESFRKNKRIYIFLCINIKKIYLNILIQLNLGEIIIEESKGYFDVFVIFYMKYNEIFNNINFVIEQFVYVVIY